MGANDGAVLGHAGVARSVNSGKFGGKLENYVNIIYGSVCAIYTEDGYAMSKTE